MRQKNYFCKECGGNLIESSEEVYCKKCGLVQDDAPINHGKETPVTEVSAPVTYLNPGVGTRM